MPIVPLYPVGGASPQPLPNVSPNVPAAGEPAMFGADRAHDLQAAGQQVSQASDTLAALYERTAREANNTRVQDLNNSTAGARSCWPITAGRAPMRSRAPMPQPAS